MVSYTEIDFRLTQLSCSGFRGGIGGQGRDWWSGEGLVVSYTEIDFRLTQLSCSGFREAER